MSDFQKCPECNKALDMVCVCTPDNYYVQLPASDHVSKSELRAWCEEHRYIPSSTGDYIEGYNDALQELLDHFCKEGES